MYESSHRLDMLLLHIKANTQVLNSLSREFSSHPSKHMSVLDNDHSQIIHRQDLIVPREQFKLTFFHY